MAIEYIGAGRQGIHSFRADILQVYASAWNLDYAERRELLEAFGETFDRHTIRQEYRAVIARDDQSGKLAGFCYGYPGGPGMWWYEHVAQGLGPEGVRRWLTDYFEVVELAVASEYQGQGIGGALHDRILEGLRNSTAALSTKMGETVAFAMYCKRGWVSLLEDFCFSSGGVPYRIMGRDLPRVLN